MDGWMDGIELLTPGFGLDAAFLIEDEETQRHHEIRSVEITFGTNLVQFVFSQTQRRLLLGDESRVDLELADLQSCRTTLHTIVIQINIQK